MGFQRHVRVLCCLLGLLLLPGCTPIRYLQYNGRDAHSKPYGSWPMGGGAMAETRYALPVYRGWPERPYRVLGSLTFEDPNEEWDEGIINDATRQARKRQADAIIIRRGGEFGVTKFAGAAGREVLIGRTDQTTALAIAWLTTAEIESHDKLLDERIAALATLFSPNRNVAQMVQAFIIERGALFNSNDAANQFPEIMRRLIANVPANLSGEWIFKNTFSSGSALNDDGDSVAHGIARVTTDGDAVTIISTTGAIELNFSGTLSRGRLSGQIGLNGISAKCDGASSRDKISVSFQTRSADGLVRGNLILQRLLPLNPRQ